MNRELSFLEFNQRILQEASDAAVPLLERLKFVSIVSANLDEFFMVRVAGLKQQVKNDVLETGPDGMLPKDQLASISVRVSAQRAEQERILLEELLPKLKKEGIHILRVADLPIAIKKDLEPVFKHQIFPMLTPLAVDPGHPFPFLKNRSLNVAVHLLPEKSSLETFPLLAVIQVPKMLPRFVDVPLKGDLAVVFMEDLISAHVATVFPGMKILECVPFRVIRNWDLLFDEDEQEDLLELVQKELERRWQLDAVCLELGARATPELVSRLSTTLELTAQDVQLHRGPLALADLTELTQDLGRPDLRDEAFQPVVGPLLRDPEELFAQIHKKDILLHHPYESYEPVVELLEQAALDPAVLAIKQTLYRMNRDSPILRSLVRAAENGKHVTALVELKARFDEEINVEWARILEKSGVHVVYGMIGLKTHCKVTLIVRREPDGTRRYVHLGTGNYNEETATIYSDLSYFTARDAICGDISALFNLLTGYSEPPAWKKLLVAPLGLRKAILDLIEREHSVAEQGQEAKIILKSNALIDPEIIHALCKASQAGVEVILLIRGPCTLRMGVPGVSDRIEVRTVVDRFLEHSRILSFSHEGQEDVFITSTDMMPRNFDRRIEVMIPIEDRALKRRIVDEILGIELSDNCKSSILQPSGAHKRVKTSGAKRIRAQERFIQLARERAGAKLRKRKKRKEKKKYTK